VWHLLFQSSFYLTTGMLPHFVIKMILKQPYCVKIIFGALARRFSIIKFFKRNRFSGINKNIFTENLAKFWEAEFMTTQLK